MHAALDLLLKYLHHFPLQQNVIYFSCVFHLAILGLGLLACSDWMMINLQIHIHNNILISCHTKRTQFISLSHFFPAVALQQPNRLNCTTWVFLLRFTCPLAPSWRGSFYSLKISHFQIFHLFSQLFKSRYLTTSHNSNKHLFGRNRNSHSRT